MADTVVLAVPADADGQRLDVTVSELLGESRSRSAGRIERGEVRDPDGNPLPKSHRVATGEVLQVVAPPPEPQGAVGVPPPPFRFEDDHLVVVDKPAGLVVHPGTGNPAGTLVQALQEAGIPLATAAGEHRPGIVHRLDRGTSGLLVVAKSDVAYHGLVAALRDREVERRYLTLVEGRPAAPALRIEVPLGRDPIHRKRFAARADGKHAVTHVDLVAGGRAGDRPVALLACRLETGRTHQIRVHLEHAGHPVVGDETYGATPAVAAAVGLDRPFLHAHRLRFRHPVSGDPIDVRSPLPPDLSRALVAAGIDGAVELA